jgi:hypothetical protein
MTLDGGSVEDQVQLRQVCLPVLRCVAVSIVPPVLDSLTSFFCHRHSVTSAIDVCDRTAPSHFLLYIASHFSNSISSQSAPRELHNWENRPEVYLFTLFDLQQPSSAESQGKLRSLSLRRCLGLILFFFFFFFFFVFVIVLFCSYCYRCFFSFDATAYWPRIDSEVTNSYKLCCESLERKSVR